MKIRKGWAAIFAIFALAVPARAANSSDIELTWMSVANWYVQIGDLRIVLDGWITRLPDPSFFFAPKKFPGDKFAFTKEAASVDFAAVNKVRKALLGDAQLDYLLSGHSHFDHSWDTPTWAQQAGGVIIGPRSTCLQAAAQGLPASRCREVNGGEKIDLGNGVTMRVVRLNHSGDTSNPIQHFARELYDPPVPDAQGRFRAGVGEDYPNGGGSRAFLFTVDRGGRMLSFFLQTSASAFDLEKSIELDGVNYGSPIGNLAAAMKDAGLTSVDLWIGTGGVEVAKRMVPVLKPKFYVPSHWDGLFNPFWAGMPYPFKDEELKAYLDAQKIALLPQQQYFDGYRLGTSGVTRLPNVDLKKKLGFAEVQTFSTAMYEAVRMVPSTSRGDDCGEGFFGFAWMAVTAEGPERLKKAWLAVSLPGAPCR